MTTLLLIRHGQNDWVNKHRLAGWTPGVHLNEVGQEQAKGVAERLGHLPITTIYTSPLERCVETATPLANVLELEPNILPDIGEVRYGKWEGKKIKSLAKKKKWYGVQHYPSRTRFPEGESLYEVQARAVGAFEQLSEKHPDEWVAAFAHADLIKLVLAHYLGTHIDLFQRIIVSPASVSVINLMPNSVVRVSRVNDNGPIQAPKPKEEK